MNDVERVGTSIRSLLPPIGDQRTAHDLWPAVVRRLNGPPAWSHADLGVAAAVIASLVLFPEGLWLLVYHL